MPSDIGLRAQHSVIQAGFGWQDPDRFDLDGVTDGLSGIARLPVRA